MAAPTRTELEAEFDALKVELSDARVPDGRTGLTSLTLPEYREEIRRRMSEVRAALAMLDAQAGVASGCSVREY